MLNLYEAGHGDPVVLLHAYPCNHTMWLEQALALANAGYRVLAPDLPGFGQSELPTGPPDLAHSAAEVLATLDAARVASFSLGGLSMGGYVAMEILRQAPDRVERLLLVDTKATDDGPEARQAREDVAAAALAAGSLAPLAEGMLTGLLGETTRATNPEAVERTRVFIESADARAAAWSMRAMAKRPDSLPDLARFAGPALVLAGQEDTLSPLAEQQLMTAALPNVETVYLPECGHLSALEKPAEVSLELLEFLTRSG